MDTKEAQTHHGQAIKHFRKVYRKTQEALADDLGPDWTQQSVSDLEKQRVINKELLDRIAQIIGVPREAIENWEEDETSINIYNPSFTSFSGHAVAAAMNYKCTFNPIEKIMELFEATKTLQQEKEELYKELLKEKQSHIDELRKLKK